MRKTNLFGTATLVLILALGSVPALGAASESVCTPEGCAVPKGGQTDQPLPAYHDYALFIAGLSNPESTLAAYQDQPAWVRHARFFDHNWERFTRGRLAPMRQWAAQELGSATAATVFYPFSGPDFVNVFALFPRAKTYLLVALEPVGRMPDFAAGNEQNFFPSLQRSLYDLLQLDFFKTNQMKSSIGKSETQGHAPGPDVFPGQGTGPGPGRAVLGHEAGWNHRRVPGGGSGRSPRAAFRGCGSSSPARARRKIRRFTTFSSICATIPWRATSLSSLS